MDRLRDEGPALVREAGDDDVGLGKLGRALDNCRERLVEARNPGRFSGGSHLAPRSELSPIDCR